MLHVFVFFKFNLILFLNFLFPSFRARSAARYASLVIIKGAVVANFLYNCIVGICFIDC